MTLLGYPKVIRDKKSYILVVSHMRSYSSLLCHILGSHRDISGYAEMHQSYSSSWDLMKLRCKVYRSNGGKLDGTYVLDKMLHKFRIAPEIINRENVRLILLLREPEASVKSIVDMAAKESRSRGYKDPRKALDHYEERLDFLKSRAREAEGKAFFLEAERIIGDSETVLDSLTRWLGLGDKLTPNYSRFKYTGVPGYGDPSELIKSGVIVKRERQSSGVHLDQAILDRAIESYESCREVLRSHCANV